MKTDTTTLIKRMRTDAYDIQYGDCGIGGALYGLWTGADHLEKLHKQQQPKLVDENTPKDRPLLMYWPEYGWYRALWFCEQFIVSVDPYMTCDTKPTHWMELPPEPKGVNNVEEEKETND